jgi:hypothetical protein
MTQEPRLNVARRQSASSRRRTLAVKPYVRVDPTEPREDSMK